jgi:hypothetical protein
LDCDVREGKNNRRSFDSLRDAPVAQDDKSLVMQSFCAESIVEIEAVKDRQKERMKMANRTKEVFDATASSYDADRSLLIPGCDTF